MPLREQAEPPGGGPSDALASIKHAERVSLVLAAGKTGVWAWNPATRDLTWDERVAACWGIKAAEAPSVDAFVASVHADDRARLHSSLSALIADEAVDDHDLEFRIRRFDSGRERWISARARAFRGETGEISEIIGTAQDVTEQKLHDIHLHMLLREITHRSKNLLAIIQAMARQTVKDSLTAEDFERRLSLRLRGLAASHELLAAQDWHGAHMEELVKGQLADVMTQYPGRVTLKGDSLFLKPEAAQNIGLALNELATNAMRFGALSNEEGRVEIAWAVDTADAGGRRLHVTWNEFGGPVVAPPSRQGFGHKVVERVAARALDGSVSLTFAPTGLQWSLRIPATFVLSERPASRSEMPKFF
jgi:PAS domain S-box-containing protein